MALDARAAAGGTAPAFPPSGGSFRRLRARSLCGSTLPRCSASRVAALTSLVLLLLLLRLSFAPLGDARQPLGVRALSPVPPLRSPPPPPPHAPAAPCGRSATARGSAPLQILALGDSITDGRRCGGKHTYPELLAARLGARYEVQKFALGGTGVRRGGGRSFWDTAQWRGALAAEDVDGVLVMFGSNDAKEPRWDAAAERRFSEDYAALVAALRAAREDRAAPPPCVWLLAPPPARDNGLGINASTVNERLPQAVARVAAGVGAGLVDVFSAMGGAAGAASDAGARTLMCDGVHPTDDGLALVAAAALEALRRAAAALQWPAPPEG